MAKVEALLRDAHEGNTQYLYAPIIKHSCGGFAFCDECSQVF